MKTWIRSNKNKKIAGICGGLSEMFNIDATLIRFIFIFLLLSGISFFTVIFLYLIAWAIVPLDEIIETETLYG